MRPHVCTLVPIPTPRPRGLARALGAAMVVLFAAVLAGACGDASTGPEVPGPGAPVTAASVAGRYALVAYDGRPLPAVVTEQPGEFRVELLGATLDLGADRGFAMERRSRETNLRSGQVATATHQVRGQFVIRGRALRFDDVGDPTVDGTDAAVSGDTLTHGPFTFRR